MNYTKTHKIIQLLRDFDIENAITELENDSVSYRLGNAILAAIDAGKGAPVSPEEISLFIGLYHAHLNVQMRDIYQQLMVMVNVGVIKRYHKGLYVQSDKPEKPLLLNLTNAEKGVYKIICSGITTYTDIVKRSKFKSTATENALKRLVDGGFVKKEKRGSYSKV